jgi:hypothetical protein
MNRKGLAIVVLVAIILVLLFSGGRSNFGMGDQAASSVSGMNVSRINAQSSLGVSHTAGVVHMNPGGVDHMGDNIGQTVSSASLIPRDVVATEDFGQFSPEKILGNQNYLDPRSQIGYPETLGGVLRNANQQERSEPLNPRTPVSIFNLSTIPPDVMRPKFEIDFEYQ